MKIFIPIFIVIALVSCGKVDVPEEFQNHNIIDISGSNDAQLALLYSNDKYWESGTLVDGVRQGPWITYHRKSYTPHFITNYKNGVLEGNYDEFNDKGELTIHAFCVNGQFDGEYKEYLTGTMIKKQHFVNGQIEGEVWNYYPETGKRMSVLNYKNGLQDGISTYYNESGFANMEYIYEKGEQLSSKEIPVE